MAQRIQGGHSKEDQGTRWGRVRKLRQELIQRSPVRHRKEIAQTQGHIPGERKSGQSIPSWLQITRCW
jgi:hypothetical protein